MLVYVELMQSSHSHLKIVFTDFKSCFKSDAPMSSYYCLFKLGGTLIFNAEYCESFQLFLKCYQYLKLLAIFW